MPISGVSLWELTWSKTLRNVPITNIGTFRFIVKQVVFFWLFFHLFYLVCGQIHQAIHLFLETFRPLKCANLIVLFYKVRWYMIINNYRVRIFCKSILPLLSTWARTWIYHYDVHIESLCLLYRNKRHSSCPFEISNLLTFGYS